MSEASEVKLTCMTQNGGWAAKVEPDALSQVLRQLPKFHDPNLIVGFDTADDAAVYKIDDSTALIQTVDIFPPVVDDPFSYGQIAAANSLSDVYAMGGRPKLAMNIVCMPEDLDKKIIAEILQGGYSKCKEAETIICGGHTIKDKEPKYGLCVSGFVHPDKVLKNNAVREGDVLILTKALGTGVFADEESNRVKWLNQGHPTRKSRTGFKHLSF